MPKKSYNIHLAKSDISEFDEVLSEAALSKISNERTQVYVDEDFGDGAKLFVFSGQSRPPEWMNDVGVYFPVKPVNSNSSCALLCFKKSKRIFIASFAHGWMFLNDNNIEGNFGLRVALNMLDDEKLSRLERDNLGDAMRGVALSPFQRDFSSFGTDDALDLVRKLSGKSVSTAKSEKMTGAKSLKLSGEFGLGALPELADEALEAFVSDRYRETSFRVIDFVSPVMDKRLITKLDESAVAAIRDHKGYFELGLPTNYAEDGVAFKFAGPGLRNKYPDLLLEHYTKSLGSRLEELDTQTIRDHQIIAEFEEPGRPPRKWPIRNGLIGSIRVRDSIYAINEGEWYRVDEAFKNDIELFFQSLQKNWVKKPIPLKKIYDDQGKNGVYETEASYNLRLAEHFDFLCLDQKLIKISGIERSDFEACDLLDISGRRFIQVNKNSRRSNVLSHFFMHGSSLAQNFARFPSAWNALLKTVHTNWGEEQYESLREAQYSNDKWSVEYWIADSPRANTGEFNIPFFSRITLRDEARNLRAMQYKVAVRFIGLEASVIPNVSA